MRARARVYVGAVLAAAVLLAQAACKDSLVPNYNSPQVNPLSPAGIQFRTIGVVSGAREEMGNFIIAMNSFSRDAGNYTTTDNRYITEWQGAGALIPNSDFYGTVFWDVEFRNARDAQLILNDLPHVTPAYSASDLAALTGVEQTLKAYNFMLIAESHDTLGVPIAGINTSPTTPAPILCAKDTWAAIVAMLDSGFNALAASTPGNPLPINLPVGFSSVSASGKAFAAFNRALAAKAGVELAFGIARSPGGNAPTPTSAGTPDVAALTRADSAARASALFPATPTSVFVQTAVGDFADPTGVYHTFNGASGDIANPVQAGLPTFFIYDSTYIVLKAAATGGTVGRIGKALLQGTKLTGGNTPPFPQFNFAVSIPAGADTDYFTTGNYPTPNSPIPMIRGEDLSLFDAVAQLGLGNTANAVAIIDGIHTAAGELPSGLTGASSYTAVRDQLLQEFRMSNFGEGGDRTIMVRNYGMQALTANTWNALPAGDTHATVIPIPTGEASARRNNTAFVCP